MIEILNLFSEPQQVLLQALISKENIYGVLTYAEINALFPHYAPITLHGFVHGINKVLAGMGSVWRVGFDNHSGGPNSLGLGIIMQGVEDGGYEALESRLRKKLLEQIAAHIADQILDWKGSDYIQAYPLEIDNGKYPSPKIVIVKLGSALYFMICTSQEQVNTLCTLATCGGYIDAVLYELQNNESVKLSGQVSAINSAAASAGIDTFLVAARPVGYRLNEVPRARLDYILSEFKNKRLSDLGESLNGSGTQLRNIKTSRLNLWKLEPQNRFKYSLRRLPNWLMSRRASLTHIC